MNLKIKSHLIIALILMEVAVIGLGRSSSESSVIALTDIRNMLAGSANRIGAKFPLGAMYEVSGKVRYLQHKGQPTFVIFIGCDCSIGASNEWAIAAKRNGENVIQVFLESLTGLRSVLKQYVIEGTAVTCSPQKAFAIIGQKDMARLPIGYHLEPTGKLISKQL
jgi:hypothetical protein